MIVAFLTLMAAGIIKGAIGSGVPVIVIPVLTMLYDVKLAIAVLVAPNLFSNALQVWQYRHHLLPHRFLLWFGLSGGLGIVIGTWGLVVLSPTLLSLGVAAAIVLYLAIKLANRSFTLPFPLAQRIVLPVGLVAGVLQGAAGMSAPASVTFLNAMRLERPVFIGSISVFFVAITLVQIPALLSAGILTGSARCTVWRPCWSFWQPCRWAPGWANACPIAGSTGSSCACWPRLPSRSSWMH